MNAVDTQAATPNGPGSVRGSTPRPQTEEEMFEYLAAMATKYIHKDGRQAVAALLQEEGEIYEKVGAACFQIVSQIAQQAEQSGEQLGQDILLGLATHVIDEIAELTAASGTEMGTDDKEAALMHAVMLYQEGNPAEEDPAALAAMAGDPEVDEAIAHLQSYGQ